MREVIKSNLSVFKENHDFNERDVIYLLVEIVKFLERAKVEGVENDTTIKNYSCIKLFRDWAVHGVLDHQQKYFREKVSQLGKTVQDDLYAKLFEDLIVGIESTNLVPLLEVESRDSLRKNLFRVIKDVSVIAYTDVKKFTPVDEYRISIE
jgi:hypothetical protein